MKIWPWPRRTAKPSQDSVSELEKLGVGVLQTKKLAFEVIRLRRVVSVRWFELILKMLSTFAALVAVYYGIETGLLHVTEMQLAETKEAYANSKADLAIAWDAEAKAQVATAEAGRRAKVAEQNAATAFAAQINAETKTAEATKQAAEASAGRDRAIEEAKAAQVERNVALGAQAVAEAAQVAAEKKRGDAEVQAQSAIQKLDGAKKEMAVAEEQVQIAQRRLAEVQAQTDAIKMELPFLGRRIVISYSPAEEARYRALRKQLDAYLAPLLGVNLVVVRGTELVREESTASSIDRADNMAILTRLANAPEFLADTDQVFFLDTPEIDEAVRELMKKVVPVGGKWIGPPLARRDLGNVAVVISLK